MSGVGDDANPCSRTAPCKTFAGAISKTAAKGEINCLDPGGFGALTITKSIAVICDYTEGGALAGGNGFVVNALSTDNVYISGIDFHGVTGALTGINILSAQTVVIKNSQVRQFVDGIKVAPASGAIRVDVIDSVIAYNTGTGILNKPTGSGTVRMMIDRTRVLKNTGDGIMANGTTTTGSLNVSIRDTESAHNGGTGFVSFSSGAVSQMMIDTSGAFENNTGIAANGSGATVRFARSTVTANVTGVLQVAPGAAQSYSPASNSVDGNGTDGTFGTTPFK
ncbi:MAG TPA: right-handed parallel beta-helix repeat-containing protein [Beijerinckiaceae bacterium]